MHEAKEVYTKQEFFYDDLRGWIDEVRKLGELQDVEGASWEEDIGMAAELLQHSDPAPTALFGKIPGYPAGYRVLANFFGGKRMNMTLGFPGGLSRMELSDAFLKAFQESKLIPFEFVKSGPIRCYS